MSNHSITDNLFFENTDLDLNKLENVVNDTVHNADDGELFLEYKQSEGLIFDDGKIKSAAFDTLQGFGLRAISGEATGYSHTSELSSKAVARASDTVKAVTHGYNGTLAASPKKTNQI